MKKLLLIFIMLFIVTGCNNNVIYEFEKDSIKSTIELKFNQEEFKTYYKSTGGHADEEFKDTESVNDFINKLQQGTDLIAIVEDNKVEYYENTKKEQKDKEYLYEYQYNYTYDNFEKNYYLNDCFEHFITTEDNDYVHYKLSGDFTCENMDSFILKVKAKDKNIVSNADETKDDYHIWDIEKENNDITFSISKAEKTKTSVFSTVHIIGLVLLAILGIIGLVLYKLINKDK